MKDLKDKNINMEKDHNNSQIRDSKKMNRDELFTYLLSFFRTISKLEKYSIDRIAESAKLIPNNRRIGKFLLNNIDQFKEKDIELQRIVDTKNKKFYTITNLPLYLKQQKQIERQLQLKNKKEGIIEKCVVADAIILEILDVKNNLDSNCKYIYDINDIVKPEDQKNLYDGVNSGEFKLQNFPPNIKSCLVITENKYKSIVILEAKQQKIGEFLYINIATKLSKVRSYTLELLKQYNSTLHKNHGFYSETHMIKSWIAATYLDNSKYMPLFDKACTVLDLSNKIQYVEEHYAMYFFARVLEDRYFLVHGMKYVFVYIRERNIWIYDIDYGYIDTCVKEAAVSYQTSIGATYNLTDTQMNGVRNHALRMRRPIMQPELEQKIKDSRDYLVFKNGILHLPTFTLYEDKQDVFLPYQIPYNWIPIEQEINYETQCPDFLKYLNSITEGDKDYKRYMCFIIYKSLAGYGARELFCLYGFGGSGKSTLANLIKELISEYAYVPFPGTMLMKGAQFHPEALAKCERKRIGIAEELQGELNVELLKQMASDARVSARNLNEATREIILEISLFACTNDIPKISAHDTAAQERIVVIPFTNRITEEERDLNLNTKLAEQRQYIMHYIATTFKDIQREYNLENHIKFQIHFPKVVKEATDEYIERIKTSDTVYTYFKECIIKTDDPRIYITSKKLYQGYKDYMISVDKEKYTIQKVQEFGKRFKDISGIKSEQNKSLEERDQQIYRFLKFKPTDQMDIFYETYIEKDTNPNSYIEVEILHTLYGEYTMQFSKDIIPQELITLEDKFCYRFNETSELQWESRMIPTDSSGINRGKRRIYRGIKFKEGVINKIFLKKEQKENLTDSLEKLF